MDEMQSYLFREGNCAYAHQFMGAHPCKGGYDFAVWAPDARAVSVVGDFNDWDHLKNPMENHDGIWTASSSTPPINTPSAVPRGGR